MPFFSARNPPFSPFTSTASGRPHVSGKHEDAHGQCFLNRDGQAFAATEKDEKIHGVVCVVTYRFRVVHLPAQIDSQVRWRRAQEQSPIWGAPGHRQSGSSGCEGLGIQSANAWMTWAVKVRRLTCEMELQDTSLATPSGEADARRLRRDAQPREPQMRLWYALLSQVVQAVLCDGYDPPKLLIHRGQG